MIEDEVITMGSARTRAAADWECVRVPDDLAGCKALLEQQAMSLSALLKEREEARKLARDWWPYYREGINHYDVPNWLAKYPWLETQGR